jgi:3-deoxy-7-phosphoheptulonate synthase
VDNALLNIQQLPARQQPSWEDQAVVRRVREKLAANPALVTAEDVHTLRALLTRVAAGEATVLQARRVSSTCSPVP